MKSIKRYITTLCTVAMLAAGCTEDDGPVGPGNTPTDAPNTVKFDVKWSPNAVVFKAGEHNELKGIDSSVFRFYFDPNGQLAKQLTPGKIVVLNDYAIRKVKTVRNSGGQLVVETETCALTEAMVDADIAWSHTVDVSAKMLADGFGKQNGTTTQSYKDSVTVSFSWGDYEVEFTVKGKNGETAVEGKLLKQFAGNNNGNAKKANYTLNGTLKKFRSTGHIKIRGSKLQEFNMDNDNVVADFTLTAVAAGFGNDIGIEIPIPLMKYPIPQLPFILFELKALGVVNASIPTDGSCDLAIRMQYVSNQGIQFDPKTENFQPRSNVLWKGFGKPKDPKTAASSPIGVSAGIAFPRLEMGVTGTNTNVWVQTAGLIGGDFTMFPICRQAKASAIFGGGGSFALKMGPALNFKKTLWQKDTVFFKTGQCPP